MRAYILRDAFRARELNGRRVGRSYRKSQIPLTSLACYQAGGGGDGCARLSAADFFADRASGIYFFFTRARDGCVSAIGTYAVAVRGAKARGEMLASRERTNEVCNARAHRCVVLAFCAVCERTVVSVKSA